MKKLLSLVLVFAMLASVAVGCGSKKAEEVVTEATTAVETTEAVEVTEAAPKEVSIIVGDRIGDESGLNKWTLERQKAFDEAYPHITVTHIDAPQVDTLKMVQSATTILISSDAPVILNVSAVNYIKDLYAAGLAAPVNDFVKDWADWSDMYPSIASAFTNTDGNIIGFPGGIEIPSLAFNKKVLVDAGIDPDTLKVETWDDMKALAKKLTTDEVKGFGVNLTDYFLWWNNWNMSNGADTAIQNADGTITLNFAGQKTIDTVNFFRDLYKEGVTTDNVSLDLMAFLGEVWAGKHATSTYYPTWIGWWKDSGLPPEDVKIMPFPKGPSGEYGSPMFPYGFIINAKRPIEEQQAAVEYLKFMNGIEAKMSYLEFAAENDAVVVSLPMYQSLDSTAYETGTPAEWAEPIQQILASGKVLDIQSTAWTNYIVPILPKLVTDQNVDVAEELKKAQETAEKEWLNDYNAEITK